MVLVTSLLSDGSVGADGEGGGSSPDSNKAPASSHRSNIFFKNSFSDTCKGPLNISTSSIKLPLANWYTQLSNICFVLIVCRTVYKVHYATFAQ